MFGQHFHVFFRRFSISLSVYISPRISSVVVKIMFNFTVKFFIFELLVTAFDVVCFVHHLNFASFVCFLNDDSFVFRKFL